MFAYAPEEPSRHHPDPAKPVVLHVWQMKGNPNPVFSFSRKRWIKADEKPYGLDFIHHDAAGRALDEYQSATDPDIRITVSRRPLRNDSDNRAAIVTIEAVDGGFVDRAPFTGFAVQEHYRPESWIAPSEGYTPRRTWELKPPVYERWAAVYFRSRKGQVYGMFTLKLSGRYEEGTTGAFVELDGSLNVSASPNLEKDYLNGVRYVPTKDQDGRTILKPAREPPFLTY